MLLSLLSLFIHHVFRNKAKVKGKEGEKLVANKLRQLPEEYKVLNDIVFATERGTTQIDHVVVSKYGIFVIETKNYRGEIYGNDVNKEWKQIIKTDVRFNRKWYKVYTYITKNQFYSPVKQSLGHVVAVNNILNQNEGVPIVSIVVFSNDAILDNVNSSYNVINLRNLLSTIYDYKLAYISISDVERITETLQQNNVRKLVNNKTHVDNIKKSKQLSYNKIREGVCPLCGGALKLRKGKYGNFYGCSEYPKCKYTYNIR